MRFIYWLLLLGVSLIPSMSLYASDLDFTVTPELEQLIVDRSKQYVFTLNKNISYMANKKHSLTDRQYTRKSALTMFIGGGYKYEWNGMPKEGVLTQTTSLNRKTRPKEQLMRNYLQRIISMNYPQIDIKSTQLHQIQASNLRKVDDGKYEVTVCYEQTFIAKSDGGWILYGDRTRKKTKVLVEIAETIDGKELIIRLGDTTAHETSKL